MTKAGRAYTPARTRTAEADVIALVADQAPPEPLSGPVRVWVDSFLPIPKSWSKTKTEAAALGEVRPTSRPDLDNLVKLVVDAMTRAGYWRDDSQIVEMGARKFYSHKPRTTARVEGREG